MAGRTGNSTPSPGHPPGDLTDYQVRFKVYNTTGTDIGENVYLGSHVKPDFSDIRFTTTDNTVLTYWVQETGSNYAIVWVKVSSIPTTGTKIYLYYGNPSASSLSDGAATFLLFDHFDGTAVNTTRWTKSGDVTVAGSVATLNAPDETMTSVPVFGVNTALSTRASINTAVWGLVGFGDNNNLAAVYANYPSSSSLNGLNRVNAVGTQSSFPCGAVTGWNVLEIQRSSSSTTYALNGVATGSISQYLLTGSRPIYTWSQGSGQNIQLDWIFIRNFAAIEPSHSSWTPGEPNPSPPVAAFSATPLSGQFPLAVQFTDQSSMAPTSWQWDFGDATPTSTLQNPAHTYSSPGNYTVTLTVPMHTEPAQSRKTDYITVTPPPPFLSGWSYRKLHTIAGSASGALTDYQVRFKVYNTTGTDTR